MSDSSSHPPSAIRHHTSLSVPDTERLAATLAATLQPGACVALHGDLGAGKTQFVRGLVAGLGGDPKHVSSPTYVLLNVYDTPRGKVFHLDAYRVHGPDDFDAIGFSELLEQQGFVVVEWPSRVRELLPTGTIDVRIETVDETTRRILVPSPGTPGED